MPGPSNDFAALALGPPPSGTDARHRFEHRFQHLALPTAAAAFDCALGIDADGALEAALAGTLRRLGGYTGTPPLATLLPAADVALARAHLRRVLTNRPDVCVLRLETSAGTTRWLGLMTRPVCEAGRAVHVYGLVIDLSQRHASLRPLRRPLDARAA